ncbi:unnamed protein product, partial [Dicrocoelium dendriticum]
MFGMYGCETWPLRSADMKRLVTFDHRCLRSLAHIWWEHRVSIKRGMNALTSELASVRASRLPDWGPKDGEHVWLDTLADMTRRRPQWRTC